MPDQPPVEALLDASVIVPSFRGEHRLPALLDALARQDFAGSWEVLVALDGVHDGSPALLARWTDRLPLRVLAHEEHRGTAGNLNAAYAEAGGRVLIRCDDDLTPGPDFVRRHVAHHDGRTDLGVVGPTRDVLPDTAYARAYGRRAAADLLATATTRAADRRWEGWAANNSLHRDAWARGGGFDRRFRFGEDYELGWRLAREHGVEIVVDADLTAAHRGPATSARTRASRAFVAGAARRAFLAAHPEDARPAARPEGVRDRVWSLLVGLLAALVRTQPAYARLGGLLDAVLRVVPAPLGRRLVAWAVEAAGRSGIRHGFADLDRYQGHKTQERAQERARELRRRG